MVNINSTSSTSTPLINVKGIFASPIRIKGKINYNYLYDRLHHIKFLGIVTYPAKIDSEIYFATLEDRQIKFYSELDFEKITRNGESQSDELYNEIKEAKNDSYFILGRENEIRDEINNAYFFLSKHDKLTNIEKEKLFYDINSSAVFQEEELVFIPMAYGFENVLELPFINLEKITNDFLLDVTKSFHTTMSPTFFNQDILQSASVVNHFLTILKGVEVNKITKYATIEETVEYIRNDYLSESVVDYLISSTKWNKILDFVTEKFFMPTNKIQLATIFTDFVLNHLNDVNPASVVQDVLARIEKNITGLIDTTINLNLIEDKTAYIDKLNDGFNELRTTVLIEFGKFLDRVKTNDSDIQFESLFSEFLQLSKEDQLHFFAETVKLNAINLNLESILVRTNVHDGSNSNLEFKLNQFISNIKSQLDKEVHLIINKSIENIRIDNELISKLDQFYKDSIVNFETYSTKILGFSEVVEIQKAIKYEDNRLVKIEDLKDGEIKNYQSLIQNIENLADEYKLSQLSFIESEKLADQNRDSVLSYLENQSYLSDTKLQIATVDYENESMKVVHNTVLEKHDAYKKVEKLTDTVAETLALLNKNEAEIGNDLHFYQKSDLSFVENLDYRFDELVGAGKFENIFYTSNNEIQHIQLINNEYYARKLEKLVDVPKEFYGKLIGNQFLLEQYQLVHLTGNDELSVYHEIVILGKLKANVGEFDLQKMASVLKSSTVDFDTLLQQTGNEELSVYYNDEISFKKIIKDTNIESDKKSEKIKHDFEVESYSLFELTGYDDLSILYQDEVAYYKTIHQSFFLKDILGSTFNQIMDLSKDEYFEKILKTHLDILQYSAENDMDIAIIENHTKLLDTLNQVGEILQTEQAKLKQDFADVVYDLKFNELKKEYVSHLQSELAQTSNQQIVIEKENQFVGADHFVIENEQFKIAEPLRISETFVDGKEEKLDYPNVFPEIRFKHREPLEQDQGLTAPNFELNAESYLCDDYLQFPLKDFNHDNALLFYDENFNPYYPTGELDENDNPYVLPPYTILNEPISNGVNVGGKQIIPINPLNLQEFILYLVRVYEQYKSRFAVDNPIYVMSKVMNMLFDKTKKLADEWNATKNYSVDELWRIYRFIRWMAIGVTTRYYRLKMEKTYGDTIEDFTDTNYISTLTFNRVIVQQLNSNRVANGAQQQKDVNGQLTLQFDYPRKNYTSYLEFEIGNVVNERTDQVNDSGVIFLETFAEQEVKVGGEGFNIDYLDNSYQLVLENPTTKKLYTTTLIDIDRKYYDIDISINYKYTSNMNSTVRLRNVDNSINTVLTKTNGYNNLTFYNLPSSSYYIEVTTPYEESENVAFRSLSNTDIYANWYTFGDEETVEEYYVRSQFSITNNGVYREYDHLRFDFSVPHQAVEVLFYRLYNGNRTLEHTITWYGDFKGNRQVLYRMIPDATFYDYVDHLNPAVYHFNPNFLNAEGDWEIAIHPAPPDKYSNYYIFYSLKTTKMVNKTNHWKLESGNISYDNENSYILNYKADQSIINNTDYIFEGEFASITSGDFDQHFVGLIFGYQNENNFYMFGSYRIDPSNPNSNCNLGVWKITNGNYNITNTPSLHSGMPFVQTNNTFYKVKIVANENEYQIYFEDELIMDFIDYDGWGYGAVGIANFTNNYSSYRNLKYNKPSFIEFQIDNILINNGKYDTKVDKPNLLIDFYLDDTSNKKISDYNKNAKTKYSFPIIYGSHNATWVFRKTDNNVTLPSDFSYVDNIVIKESKVTGVKMTEEFIECGGHRSLKLLIDNLYEYYRRHHQGCKGKRDIWIYE